MGNDSKESATTADGFPRSDGGALFGKMMLAIRTSHTFGNRVRSGSLFLCVKTCRMYFVLWAQVGTSPSQVGEPVCVA